MPIAQIFQRGARAPTIEQRMEAFERRVIQSFGPWGNPGPESAAGVHVSSSNATQLLAVHGCVALISDTIATLPLCIYRDKENGAHEEIDARPRWLKRPNPNVTFIEFLSQTLVSLLLDGNAYWVYSVDGNGLPFEVHCLDPTIVDVVSAAPEELNPTAEYRVRGVIYRGKLVHLKGIVRPGMLKGVSPVEDAKQSIGLGLAAQEFASRFYANGASLSGVIETPQDLTFDQARDLVRKFGTDHAGLKNAHRPGLLDNGAVWRPLSVTPEQAQFLESRQFQTAEIASEMFLLDPAWFAMTPPGGTGLTYQNRAQLGEHLAQFTCARWIIRVEKAITDLLPDPQYAKFNLDALKRGDLAARAAYYTAALDPVKGWMVQDEVRDLEDLGPMPKKPPLPQVVPMPTPVPPVAAGTNGSS